MHSAYRRNKERKKPLTLHADLRYRPSSIGGSADKDDNLMTRALSHWQLGHWDWLAGLELKTFWHHSDRSTLALLKAAGHLQLNQLALAHKSISLARKWGASKTRISYILISGVYNTLGQAAAYSGHRQQALRHFAQAIELLPESGDSRIGSYVRAGRQMTINGFAPQAPAIGFSHGGQHLEKVNRTVQQRSHPLLIEIMGLPGIGKTTILQRAYKKNNARWMHGSGMKNIVEANGVTIDAIRNYMDVNLLNGFIEGCIGIVNSANMTSSQKLSAINQLQATAREYCSIMLADAQMAVVYDELFMHRAFALLMLSDNLEKTASWYFNNCPIPYAVITFVDSIPSVIARVIGRNKPINTLKYLSEKDIENMYWKSTTLYSVAEQVLRTRGVVFYTLPVSDTIEKTAVNLALVIDGIMELSAHQPESANHVY